MARYKLTETQQKSLNDAQMALAQAQFQYQQAQETLNVISGLIFDAHGIELLEGSAIDIKTWELVTPDDGQIEGSDIGQTSQQ